MASLFNKDDMGKRYRFERGLGKEDIGIAVYCCLNCRKTGATLYAVDDGRGNKAYVCENCKGNYKKYEKKKGGRSEKDIKK